MNYYCIKKYKQRVFIKIYELLLYFLYINTYTFQKKILKGELKWFIAHPLQWAKELKVEDSSCFTKWT